MKIALIVMGVVFILWLIIRASYLVGYNDGYLFGRDQTCYKWSRFAERFADEEEILQHAKYNSGLYYPKVIDEQMQDPDDADET